MADNRVIKTMYVDTEACEIKDYKNSAFAVLSPGMSLFRGTQVLFEAHLMLSDGTTYITTPTGATWLFGIDDQFTRDHADLVTVENDQFIAADWPGVDGADFANGKICWRTDLTGVALETSLGSLASKPMYAGLWMLPSGGSYTLVCQWELTMRNIAVEPT
jgi:hypothetical protein